MSQSADCPHKRSRPQKYPFWVGLILSFKFNYTLIIIHRSVLLLMQCNPPHFPIIGGIIDQILEGSCSLIYPLRCF